MPLNEEERSELVAYLDGELDEATTQIVEAKLATDADARAELDALKQTWGMLDYLPQASPSVNFTNRTLERLTLEKVQPAATVAYPMAWLSVAGWAAAVVLAVGVGYVASGYLWPSPEPILDADLPLVLDPHADWLEQLRKSDPPAFRAINEAPDSATRLTLIKERRDRDWIATQPRAIREQWDKLDREARGKLVAELRDEERQQRQQWVIAKRFWNELERKQPLPSRHGDFSEKVRNYVSEYLMPSLSKAEKQQLENAEGRWPDYPQVLVEIARKHPSALPPEPPRKFAQLPAPVQQRLVTDKKTGTVVQKKLLKELQQYEGPNFASKAVAIGLREQRIPFGFGHEYLAPSFKSLLPPMQDFVEKVLLPALDQADNKKLADSQGSWPDYPLTIRELARKHGLHAPWHFLPEPERWKWDSYLSKTTSER